MTTYRSLAPALSVLLLVGYSAIATVTNGDMAATASPMLVAAIALAIWHDRTGASVAA